MYRWIDEREVALLVEISQAEAFAPARQLAWTIFMVGLVSVGLLALLVYLIARQIARPILAITNTATKVAAGDLTSKVPVLTEDEVGVLASIFNKMTGELFVLYTKLEDLVEERTSDGVVEAHNARGDLFGFERLEQAIAAAPMTNPQAMLDHLNTEIRIFLGDAEPHDDLTIVVLQV